MPSYDLSQDIGSMQSGEHRSYEHAEAGKFHVRYEAEQAMGDNGYPARGYTVGHFHVAGPGDNDVTSFRHTPQGPTLTGAKQYAADQAAKHIHTRIQTALSGRNVHPRSGRSQMDFDEPEYHEPEPQFDTWAEHRGER